MSIDEIQFANLKYAFNREYNRVECYRSRRKLTKDKDLRKEYRTELTRTYNKLTHFLHLTHLNGDLEEKIETQNRQVLYKNKLKETFKWIKVTYEFTNKSFEQIDISKVIENVTSEEIESESEEDNNDSGEENNENNLSDKTIVDENSETSSQGGPSTYSSPLSGINLTDDLNLNETSVSGVAKLNRTSSLESVIPKPDIIRKQRQSLIIELNNTEHKMAFEYISNVSRVIKNTFNGDANEVDAFVASIELADSASEAADQANLVKFIRTKLTGPAVDFVPATTATAAEVIRLIREKVKGDNTQVVMGRLLALRTDKNSLQNFQTQAEELAEKLKKSYINEGIPHDLANRMTIDKTVEMCRLSARTPLVKSVLASTKFDQPKEVLAKFITEAAQENTEVKILSFRNNQNNFRGNRRGNNFNRGNFNRGGYNNNNNYRNNGYNNYNGNSNGFRGRGRGRGRGNGYRNFNNYNNNYNNNNNGQNNGGRYVRAIQENGQAPPQERGNQQQVEVRQA